MNETNKRTRLTVSTLASQTENVKGKRKETTTQRKRRLAKEKRKRQEKLANETAEEKRLRLDKRKQRLRDEPPKQREARLLKDRQRHTPSIIYKRRLEKEKQKHQEMLAKETAEKKHLRLNKRKQKLRDAQSITHKQRLEKEKPKGQEKLANETAEEKWLQLNKQNRRVCYAPVKQRKTQRHALSITYETQEQREFFNEKMSSSHDLAYLKAEEKLLKLYLEYFKDQLYALQVEELNLKCMMREKKLAERDGSTTPKFIVPKLEPQPTTPKEEKLEDLNLNVRNAIDVLYHNDEMEIDED